MREALVGYVNGLPKYSVTVTLDFSLVLAAIVGVIAIAVVFIAGKNLKTVLLNQGNEASEPMELVNDEDVSFSQTEKKEPPRSQPLENTTNNNSSANFSTPPLTKPTFRKYDGTPSQNGTVRSKSNTSVSSSVNTSYDLEEFMARLYKYYFVVYRIKDPANGTFDLSRKRVMKINSNCELVLYKNFYELSNVDDNASLPTVTPSGRNNHIPAKTPVKSSSKPTNGNFNVTGSPYIQLPLSDLVSCINCDEDSSAKIKSPHGNFILEFKRKTLILRAAVPLDNTYLIQGFEQLIPRMKHDHYYLDSWKQRFTSSVGGNLITPQTKYTPTPRKLKSNDSEDGFDYGSIYSYNSGDKIVDDIDARLARKRASERLSQTVITPLK